MKWRIPAKTFLVGEYAAISGAPAIVLTTSPYFEISTTETIGLDGIHPESPGGRWWNAQGFSDIGLKWHDPFRGQGGLGASTAQFLGAYLASIWHSKKAFHQHELLEAYLRFAWNGVGVQPSGYDILAQSSKGCVYIHREHNDVQSLSWPFNDLAFVLVHTGQKLATHEHLQSLSLSTQIQPLITIVNAAKLAFEQADSQRLIAAVNAYHQQLLHLNLVATHSIQCIKALQINPDILAIKGCGAMGADVVLILVAKTKLTTLLNDLASHFWQIIATSEMISSKNT